MVDHEWHRSDTGEVFMEALADAWVPIAAVRNGALAGQQVVGHPRAVRKVCETLGERFFAVLSGHLSEDRYRDPDDLPCRKTLERAPDDVISSKDGRYQGSGDPRSA